MTHTSRRSFLATTSLALAGAGLGIPSTARSGSLVLPQRSRRPISEFLPDPIDPAVLRALASTAVEAASHAGAVYADVRVSSLRRLRMWQSGPPLPFSDLDLLYGYNVRVRVGGAWSTAFGIDPTTDSITRSAQSAVATAKGLARVTSTDVAFARVPAERGEWATPIEIDPFSVSPDDHARILGAYKDMAERVLDATTEFDQFTWTAETRVFASTEGGLVTQRLARVSPEVRMNVWPPDKKGPSYLKVPEFGPVSAGLECVLGPALQERIKIAAEEVMRLASYPEGVPETGRYEVIVDGSALAMMFDATLARALEMPRVLGQDADDGGTSFLAPVDDVLGQQLFSPQLTVTNDRAMPHYHAAKWDDEGVAVRSFPVIERGAVVDYFATRATIAALAPWYAKRGLPTEPRGCAVSWTPRSMPVDTGTQMRIDAGTSGATFESLVQQLSRGIVIRGLTLSYGGISTDPQLAGGAFMPFMMFEVKNGRVVRRLKSSTVQFSTKQLWKDIVTLGDESTRQQHVQSLWRGDAWTPRPVSAPAAHLRQIDVISFPRFNS
jgi:TldD protein